MQQALVRKERWPGGLNVRVVPLVRPGQEVVPDQPVLRVLSRNAGERQAVRYALSLSTSKDKEDTEILPAGLHGRVVGITARGGVLIESPSVVVRGVIGSGNQVAGVLALWQVGSTWEEPRAIPPGAILVVPGQVTLAMLHQALSSGVVGIVAGSIALRDFEGFLRSDLIQLLTCVNAEQAQTCLPSLTIMLTEGIGNFSMPAYVVRLLSHYQGSIALLSGITSVYHNIWPDLLISLPAATASEKRPPVVAADAEPAPGVLVRVLGGEHAGKTGRVEYLFVYPQSFASGI
ncbi:MAG: hypothetical protein IMW89_22985, partial [Ktedonobacteraceae bacterium]|nr:hypothetical protein [Ktedonobacteraceae bacterium]